ncbi:MAG: FMN-binding protein [Mariniblastus sp.]
MKSELPILNSAETVVKKSNSNALRIKRVAVHCVRVGLFILILLLIRFAHRQTQFVDSNLEKNETAIALVQSVIPEAATILPFDAGLGGNAIVDVTGERMGYALQTSPASDNIIGYSGPTNCLITMDLENQIQTVSVLSSQDTIEHVELVTADKAFFESFQGLGFDSEDRWNQVDAVSGATLTSYSIIASVAKRMGGEAPSLKFNAKPDLGNVAALFPLADRIAPAKRKLIWDVFEGQSKLGFVLTTTPVADHLSGYQGPTVTIAGFDTDEKCIGLVVDQTYDNQPYASYLNDDYGFLNFYVGKTLPQIAGLAPQSNGIEGVSGATMTSMSVAEGLVLAANAANNPTANEDQKSPNQKAVYSRDLISFWADALTVVLMLMGIVFSLTKLSRRKWVRICFQIAVITFLGFINGHMLSQASMVGWSKHALPWSVAPGLVLLSLAALAIPIVSKHQTYCQHICPFGAMQQLGRSWLPWRIKMPKKVAMLLNLIPFLLLLLVVIVATSASKFNLASIEPFDGFGFRVAGWATISILVLGMLFSLLSPMAYCRFGCPTGAMLNFLRFRADSDRLGQRDFGALILVATAITIAYA